MTSIQTNRLVLISDLLQITRPLAEISEQISSLSWDYDGNDVKLTRHHLLNALQRYLQASLLANDIEVWANLIESREDVSYQLGHEKQIADVLHELANPYLTQPLDSNRAAAICASLR